MVAANGSSGRAWGEGGEGEPSTKFEILVEQLDHPDFQTRRDAARQLIAAGTRQSREAEADVAEALVKGLKHRSIEVRSGSKEALLEIQQIRRDAQIERLLNPRCDAAEVQLAGWPEFLRLTGADMPARRLFATLSDQYPRELRQFEHPGSCPSLRRLAEKLDPYQLPQEDVAGWLMLLFLDMQQRVAAPANAAPSDLTPRISMALSNSSMGPKVTARREAQVLRRLIDHWVHVPDGGCAMRERMLIAMRYDCQSTASKLCEQVFADDSVSASTQVTALLCGLALDSTDIEAQALLRLQDDRTAHVWQLIASRKTKIRTQVRDVALAVLLHHHGVDPRTVGFDDLQADPRLVFRDHSLGFPDERSRRQSYQVAIKRLPRTAAP